jgi:hypothetical protein
MKCKLLEYEITFITLIEDLKTLQNLIQKIHLN